MTREAAAAQPAAGQPGQRLAFLGVWFFTLAPTVIGGPAGYIEVSGHSMDGTYKTGNIILTRAHDSYAKGDIIVYDAGPGQVVHRIIGGNGTTGYTTQGDNNPDPDPWHPKDDQVVGQAWHRFEGKAWILHLPRQPWFAGAGGRTVHARGARLGRPSASRSIRGSRLSRHSRREATPVVVPELETAERVLIPLQRTDSTPARVTRAARQTRRAAETPAEQAPQAEQ